MKLFAYTVFDSKSSAFKPPFYLSTDGEALRAFGDACNMPENPLGQHPEDYTLFKLGEYDDKTALFEPEKTPKSMGLGVEFVVDKTISINEHQRVVEQLEELKSTKEQAL